MRVLAVLLALVLAAPAHAAWFTDNGDRAPLADLRAKPEAYLTPVEREILTAANRIGWLEIPECGWGSNAVLVNVEGQDYAVTSLHLMTGKGPGEVHCEPGLSAIYMPNAAYISPEQDARRAETGGSGEDFSRETVALDPDPVNFSRQGVGMPWVQDWVAFRLTANISGRDMPPGTWGEGHPRGAMPWSKRQNPSGPVWVIGYDGRFDAENGWQFSWQGCRQIRTLYDNGFIYFSCDVSPGASSSLIAVMEEGRLTFQGIITASMEPMTGTDIPLPESALLWNIGTASDRIQAKLDPGSLPARSGWRGLWP